MTDIVIAFALAAVACLVLAATVDLLGQRVWRRLPTFLAGLAGVAAISALALAVFAASDTWTLAIIAYGVLMAI